MHILFTLFEDVIPSLLSDALSLRRSFFFFPLLHPKTKFKTADVNAVSCQLGTQSTQSTQSSQEFYRPV